MHLFQLKNLMAECHLHYCDNSTNGNPGGMQHQQTG